MLGPESVRDQTANPLASKAATPADPALRGRRGLAGAFLGVTPIEVTYSGLSGQFPGLGQINAVIPPATVVPYRGRLPLFVVSGTAAREVLARAGNQAPQRPPVLAPFALSRGAAREAREAARKTGPTIACELSG